jgi:hypothetical protein
VTRMTRGDDAAAMRVLSSSTVGRAIGRIADGVERARPDSRARAALAGSAAESLVERIRAGSLVALVAALVALLLPLAGTRPEPLFWVVPGIAVIVALLIIWFASPGRQEIRRA